MERRNRRILSAAVAVLAVALITLGSWCGKERRPSETAKPPARPIPGSALARALALPCEDSVPPSREIEYDTTLVSSRALDNRLLHDCQKLIVRPEEYGPLVAILVPSDSDMKKRIDRSAGGVVIADIVNYDSVLSYDRLNIKPYLNCLWVKGPRDHPEQWQADVRQGTSCADTTKLFTLPRDPGLSVHPVPYTPDGTHHSTARWGWKEGVQFIGIHCGMAWCEIGPHGFTGSGAQSGDLIGLADEQYLAEDDSAAPGKVRPSHVWGRIEPYSVLGTADSTGLKHDTPVARIILRNDAPDPPAPGLSNASVHARYTDRYALSGDTTDLHMRYDAGSYYVGTPRTLATANKKWTKLNRCPWRHAAIGAVRWRWAPKDEYAWLACSDGCCSTTRIEY